MQIASIGKPVSVLDLETGKLFVCRSSGYVGFGMAAGSKGSAPTFAVLLNGTGRDPKPQIVRDVDLRGELVAEIDAEIVPLIDKKSLDADAPTEGTLIFEGDRVWMKVASRIAGSAFVNLRDGATLMTGQPPPPGIEIPRWSIRHYDHRGNPTTLFEFVGA